MCLLQSSSFRQDSMGLVWVDFVVSSLVVHYFFFLIFLFKLLKFFNSKESSIILRKGPGNLCGGQKINQSRCPRRGKNLMNIYKK